MLMYIREAFLQNAKQPELQFPWKPAHLFRRIESNFDPAALSESRHIPRQNAGQAKFFEQRRMQKIRNRADLRQSLIDELRAFVEVSGGARMDGSEMLLGKREVQLGHGKQLTGAIVQ